MNKIIDRTENIKVILESTRGHNIINSYNSILQKYQCEPLLFKAYAIVLTPERNKFIVEKLEKNYKKQQNAILANLGVHIFENTLYKEEDFQQTFIINPSESVIEFLLDISIFRVAILFEVLNKSKGFLSNRVYNGQKLFNNPMIQDTYANSLSLAKELQVNISSSEVHININDLMRINKRLDDAEILVGPLMGGHGFVNGGIHYYLYFSRFIGNMYLKGGIND